MGCDRLTLQACCGCHLPRARMHPEDFVSHFFKKTMYLSSYKPIFYPIEREHGWTKKNTPDIMPPGFKDHLKGRRQEQRRKGKFEVPKPKETSRMATITCSNFKLQGHKYTSCSVSLRHDLAKRKNNHTVFSLHFILACISDHFDLGVIYFCRPVEQCLIQVLCRCDTKFLPSS